MKEKLFLLFTVDLVSDYDFTKFEEAFQGKTLSRQEISDKVYEITERDDVFSASEALLLVPEELAEKLNKDYISSEHFWFFVVEVTD